MNLSFIMFDLLKLSNSNAVESHCKNPFLEIV